MRIGIKSSAIASKPINAPNIVDVFVAVAVVVLVDVLVHVLVVVVVVVARFRT